MLIEAGLTEAGTCPQGSFQGLTEAGTSPQDGMIAGLIAAAKASASSALPLQLQQQQLPQQQEPLDQLDDYEDDAEDYEIQPPGRPPGPGARQIAAAKAAGKNKTARAKAKLHHAIQMASGGSASSAIAANTFGYGLPCSEKYNQKSQETTIAGVVMAVKKTNQKQTHIVKGLTSHLKAVQTQLQCYMQDTDYLVHSEIEDEASMWCRRSLTKKELAAAKEEEKRKKLSGNKN